MTAVCPQMIMLQNFLAAEVMAVNGKAQQLPRPTAVVERSIAYHQFTREIVTGEPEVGRQFGEFSIYIERRLFPSGRNRREQFLSRLNDMIDPHVKCMKATLVF